MVLAAISPRFVDPVASARLADRRNRHLAAAAHAAKGRPRIQACEGQEKGPEQEQVHDGEQIGDRVEGQRRHEYRHDERDDHRAAEHNEGRDVKHPRRVVRDDDLFAEQLAQFGVRLPDRRAAPVLQAGLHPPDETREAWSQRKREQRLSHLHSHSHRVEHAALPSWLSDPLSRRHRSV
jgi:hypothetical protein